MQEEDREHVWHLTMGLLHAKTGNKDGSILHYEKAIAANRTYQALTNLANVLAVRAIPAQSCRETTTGSHLIGTTNGLEAKVRTYQALTNLANVRYEQSLHNLAEKLLLEAISLAPPTDWRPKFKLALVYND